MRYSQLLAFDKAMISLDKKGKLPQTRVESSYIHNGDKVILYCKGDYVFAFNFNPERSFEGYFIPTNDTGVYRAVLSTDEGEFGGYDGVDMKYSYNATYQTDGRIGFMCYLPSRTATVFKKIKD